MTISQPIVQPRPERTAETGPWVSQERLQREGRSWPSPNTSATATPSVKPTGKVYQLQNGQLPCTRLWGTQLGNV